MTESVIFRIHWFYLKGMREVASIQQKNDRIWILGAVFLSVGIMGYSVFYPKETGETIRRALLLFAEKILPSLFAFSVSAKILTRSGFCERLERTPLCRLFPFFGVSAAGFSAMLLGFLSGFPVGASVLAELVSGGRMKREEAESLLPFCNNAGAAFVIGTVGLLVFDSAEIGRALYLAQTVAALFAVILTARGRIPFLSFSALERRREGAAVSLVTSAIGEGAISMVGIGGYIVFFSVVTKMLFRVFHAFLPFFDGIFAIFSGFLEISGGIALISEMSFPEFERLVLCGFLLGFGGISVWMQVADRAENAGISLSFYWRGKCMTALFCALLAPLFCAFGERRTVPWLIFSGFLVVLTIIAVKNKIIFQKSVEKKEGMLYNRYEIQCP